MLYFKMLKEKGKLYLKGKNRKEKKEQGGRRNWIKKKI